MKSGLANPGRFAARTALLLVACVLFFPAFAEAEATGTAAREAAMAEIASVLAGPVQRGNRVQTQLVLDAVVVGSDISQASVLRADGSLFARSGEGIGAAQFPIGYAGFILSITFAAEKPGTSGSPVWATLLLIALVAAAAGSAAAYVILRRRAEISARNARDQFARKMVSQQQMFANLTDAYNDLVIDHTVHTHQRQLERRRFFADIERQKAELTEARDAALAEAIARSRFFAGMTHELRTPMNAIMGFSEAIEKQIFGPNQMDRYSDYAHDIRISAQHLLDTINHLLDLAKAESGKMELDDETLDIAAIIDDCVGMLRRLAENARVDLKAHPGHELAPYRADRRILRQILINLMSNAIKFTPEGGEVVVEAHADAADDLVITVTDNGRGIDPEDLANVFEPFVQGRIQGAGPGTGLGLPLSRTFARLHGGELVVESTVGHGTRASLLLPSWRWRRSANLDQMPAPSQPNGSTSPDQQVASFSGGGQSGVPLQNAGPPQTSGSLSAQLK